MIAALFMAVDFMINSSNLDLLMIAENDNKLFFSS
jgi:NADH:ubiquinone oxidoreductase subunit K